MFDAERYPTIRVREHAFRAHRRRQGHADRRSDDSRHDAAGHAERDVQRSRGQSADEAGNAGLFRRRTFQPRAVRIDRRGIRLSATMCTSPFRRSSFEGAAGGQRVNERRRCRSLRPRSSRARPCRCCRKASSSNARSIVVDGEGVRQNRRKIEAALQHRDHLVPGLEHLASVDALDLESLENHLIPVDRGLRGRNAEQRDLAAVIHRFEHAP